MQHMHWESFSTQTVLPSQRLARWNDYGSETLCDLTVDPCDRDCFTATLSRIEFGPLGLIEMTSTGATASGGLGVGGWAAAEKDALLLILAETGHSHFTENHRKLDLSPGDLLIRDLSKSWTHSCRAAMHMLMVKLPYSALLTRVDDPTRLQRVHLPARDPAVAFTTEVIRAINRTLKNGTSGDINDGLADVMLWDTGRPYHYARWTSDGRLLLGGGDRPHRSGKARQRAMADGVRDVRDYFTARYPALETIAFEFNWEGLFATTPDGLPYIGPHRHYPRHLFALGYGGNGMTLGFLAARLLVEWYQGRRSTDHDLFAFGRH